MIHEKARPALTLLELLVVITIIGILMGLLLSGVQKARGAAVRLECLNNMRQIGLALQQYHDQARSFPPGMSWSSGGDPFAYMNWHTRVLPYVEQQALWNGSQRAYQQTRQF